MSTEKPEGLRRDEPLAHELPVEVVERKGVGHPDSLADGIAELASIRYSRHCRATAGAVLHHNLDKVAVLGGRAEFSNNDGAYDRPVRVVLGGRASTSFSSDPVPVDKILEQAASDYLRSALPGFDRIQLTVHHKTTDSTRRPRWFSPRSVDDLPEHARPFSNDTAYLVGTWPRTAAEIVSLTTEAWFRRHTWAGSDIKVLTVRDGADITVTVCVPAFAGQMASAAEFDDAVTAAQTDLTAALQGRWSGTVTVRCNTRDNREEPLSSQYFTVSGSAIDYGEDGLVGRGNARSGVINGAHRAGNEAAFGKNPAYHVGKVGGWLVDTSARAVAAEYGPCRVGVLWHNGSSYHDPAVVDVTTRTHTSAAAECIVRDVLARTDWLDDLLAGCYLPAVEPVETLLAQLEQAPR